jgi:predicted porin
MNAKPLALAAAAMLASQCSLAQSTVNLYGALDVYVGNQQASGTASRRVVNSGFNPNSLGFTGTEDLGDGLKAGFVLEGQPLLDTGTYGQGGKFFGRQALVFVSGNWGRISAGRQHTAGRAFGVKYAGSAWLSVEPTGNFELAMGSGISPAMNADTVGARLSNSLSYASPNVGGFSFSALQSAAEGGTFATGQAKATVLGLSYAAGSFTADFVYNRIPEIAGSQVKQDDYALGATYDARFAKFFLAGQLKRGSAVAAPGSTTALAGSQAKDKFFTVGAQIPVGVGLIGVSAGKLYVSDAHRGRHAANISPGFGNVMDDASAYAVSYTYFLSKRTSLFAAYGALNNAGASDASLVPSLRPAGGGTSSLLGFGMRHSF